MSFPVKVCLHSYFLGKCLHPFDNSRVYVFGFWLDNIFKSLICIIKFEITAYCLQIVVISVFMLLCDGTYHLSMWQRKNIFESQRPMRDYIMQSSALIQQSWFFVIYSIRSIVDLRSNSRDQAEVPD